MDDLQFKIQGKLIKTYEEREPAGPFLAIPLVNTNSGLKFFNLPTYTTLGILYQGESMYPLMIAEEATKITQIVSDKFSDQEFAQEVQTHIARLSLEIDQLIYELKTQNFSSLSASELYNLYLNITHSVQDFWGFVWLLIAVDFPSVYFSNILKETIHKELPQHDINEIISVFQAVDLNQLEIGAYFQTLHSNPKNYDDILLEYPWIHWEFDEGQELTEDVLASDIVEAQNIIGWSYETQRKEMLQTIQSPEVRASLLLFNTMTTIKAQAKEKLNKLAFYAQTFIHTISQRTQKSADSIRFLLPHEMKGLLIHNTLSDTSNSINQRKHSSVYIIQNETIHIIADPEKIKKLPWKEESSESVSQIHGLIACPGKVIGAVCIIKSSKDMRQKIFTPGSVLISVSTNPNMLPIMRQAIAIITDLGGITCHAAIVSRELGIPCITGTKIATKVLKDGDLVEVDAHTGIVKLL
jgi:phosphoenolpyruvate synthase/pyruvate phosphate dikinase